MPAQAAVTEQLDCTVVSPTVTITGVGPYQFDQSSPNSCFGYNVRTSIDSSDITVEEDRPGTGWITVNPTSVVLNRGGPSGENVNGGVRITIAPGATGTVDVDFYSNQYNSSTLKVTYTITSGGGGGGGGGGGDTPSSDSGATDAVSGPGPRIQQFPRPATGTCDEAEPEGVNWSGVASGGWSDSWAQWMNDGEGGEVCTRTLIYNTSKAAWEVD